MLTEPKEKQTTVKDAYVALLTISKEIRYGGLSATQLEEIKKIDRNKVKEAIAKFYPMKWSVFLLIVTIIPAIIYFLLDPPLKYYFGVFALTALSVLIKRGGEEKGFADGYAVGFESGINEALGLSDSESAEAEKIALDIEIAERVVRGIDHRV